MENRCLCLCPFPSNRLFFSRSFSSQTYSLIFTITSCLKFECIETDCKEKLYPLSCLLCNIFLTPLFLECLPLFSPLCIKLQLTSHCVYISASSHCPFHFHCSIHFCCVFGDFIHLGYSPLAQNILFVGLSAQYLLQLLSLPSPPNFS